MKQPFINRCFRFQVIIHRHRLLRLASSGASGVHYFFVPLNRNKTVRQLGSTAEDSDWKRKVYQKGNSPLLKKNRRILVTRQLGQVPLIQGVYLAFWPWPPKPTKPEFGPQAFDPPVPELPGRKPEPSRLFRFRTRSFPRNFDVLCPGDVWHVFLGGRNFWKTKNTTFFRTHKGFFFKEAATARKCIPLPPGYPLNLGVWNLPGFSGGSILCQIYNPCRHDLDTFHSECPALGFEIFEP